MQESYAEQAEMLRRWMQRRGIEAHVTQINGITVLVPGPKLDRSRQARWDARNRLTLSCSVPGHMAQAFKEACEEEGYSTYAAIRRYVESVIREHRRVTGRRASARPGGPPRSSARLGYGRGEWQDSGTAGTPRGRSPRAPVQRPSGLRKPEPRHYDWQEDGDDLA